jgi:hypothetical protein
MKILVITAALAVVLAGGAYAQGHHGGGVGGGMGGGMGGGHPGGNFGGPSMMSHGPAGGPSGRFNGPSGQFSRNNQAMQGRTFFNQEHGRQFGRLDRDDLRHGRNLFNSARRDIDHDRLSRIGHDRDRDIDFRHRGIVRGDFFEHGRHFHFRRFFHGQFVFLVGFDDCTAWAWVHVAPGVWAWRPIDVCIG